ncbi:unnamed protein product [Owenia fusiformis]|uniref:Acetyl-CoA hydrolase n=1 Tax=Owenia fusiformis TaxID=6347 RepID=A0A8J1Y097_OWEFU|nr:unnamed protein product [Owenia fusiformis]
MATTNTVKFLRRFSGILQKQQALPLHKHNSNLQKRTFYLYSQEPFHPIPGKEPEHCKAAEAVKVVQSGHRVYIHGVAATPIPLVEALANHGIESNLRDVELLHIHTAGPGTFAQKEYEGIFRSNSLFMGPNVREAVNAGRADVMPIFLSDIPHLFRRRILNLDVAMVSVSPPDEHGYCTLGPSVDCTRAAVQNAKTIVGMVNKNMPRTFGDGIIHKSHFDYMVEGHMPLPELSKHELDLLMVDLPLSDDYVNPSEREQKIGKSIAENLVTDGATLQMGIGNIPNIVLKHLHNHKDLGVHTEMFSDGVIDLVENGNITNAKKVIQPGKIVGAFCVGTRRLYDFLDDNPFVVMGDVAHVCNTAVIAQNPRVTAINSCIEVDITGQVVSDSIGNKMHSGVGGQIDFIRGASQGLDGLGKPILAMTSTTRHGQTKIVPDIHKGAGVVTTRAHVHYIVTEYGIANLFGKNIRQRAYELIRIAHPDHQEELEKAAFEKLNIMPTP